MAISCHIQITTDEGADFDQQVFEIVPRVGEHVVLPHRHKAGVFSCRVVDVLHYPHSIDRSAERVKLIVQPES